MMYEVVAKNASASYSVGGGAAGGGVAAAAAGAGFDCWPQPANSREVTNAPKVSSVVVRVFIGCPRYAHILRNSCCRGLLARRCTTMIAATTLHSGPISVIDYRCDSGPGDRPF